MSYARDERRPPVLEQSDARKPAKQGDNHDNPDHDADHGFDRLRHWHQGNQQIPNEPEDG